MSLSDLALMIPIATCVLLLVFFRDKTVWWEYLVVALPSIILVIALRSIMVHYNTQATEYIGNYVDHVQHYDHWDEWIHRTCSYTTCSGGKYKTCTTHYYDCSYRRDHPEHWTKVDQLGIEYEISETEYNKLANQFHSDRKFVEMNRHYYTIDGDAQRYSYLKDISSVEPLISEETYENRVKASSSIFKFEKITYKTVKQWKLYDYPQVSNYHQNTVIGQAQPPKAIQAKLDYINSFLAPEKQVHVFIIFYHDQPYDVVHKQLSYWYGGGKNELLIHIGVDKQNHIQWYDATSWMDKPECTVRIKSYLSTQQTVDLSAFADFLTPTIQQYWHRKSFKDFDYIQVEVTPTQLTWIIIILLIYNIGISLWVVLNNYENEPTES